MDFKVDNADGKLLTKKDILGLFNLSDKQREDQGFGSMVLENPLLFQKEPLAPENSKGFSLNPDLSLMNNLPKLDTRTQGSSTYTPHVSPPKRFEVKHMNFEVFNTKRTPFSNSLFSSSLSERAWFYIDEQGVIQGPFTTIEMDNWFEKGYFFDELNVCHVSRSKNFFPLSDFLK